MQQGELSKQAARNTPEISFFEERIGLKMRGKGRASALCSRPRTCRRSEPLLTVPLGDRVQFKFANLDPASFVRTFSFDLDASLPSYSGESSLLSCSAAALGGSDTTQRAPLEWD